MPVSNHDVASLQRDYPKIYMACHTRHVRRRSGARLTPQESTLLAHLSARHPTRASHLAAHLGVGAPTLSPAIKRLVALGYITRTADPYDRRAAGLRLSDAGEKMMQASSVLDPERVARLLGELTPAQRRRAIDGLALLAMAALRLRKEAA